MWVRFPPGAFSFVDWRMVWTVVIADSYGYEKGENHETGRSKRQIKEYDRADVT